MRIIAILLFTVASAFGQGSLYVRSIQNTAGAAQSGATVLVCSPAATGTPCAPLLSIYTDQTLSSAISGSTVTADSKGNITFGCTPGVMKIQVTTLAGTTTYNDVCPAPIQPPKGILYTYTGDYWVQNYTGTMNAGTQYTATLTPCPDGVDVTNQYFYSVYVSDATNKEAVYVTGGSTASAPTSCTVTFTPQLSHTNPTIGSANSGLQESFNKQCGVNSLSYLNGYCDFKIAPSGPYASATANSNIYNVYTLYGLLNLHGKRLNVGAYGVVFDCETRGPCVDIGSFGMPGNSNYSGTNTIYGLNVGTGINYPSPSDVAYRGVKIVSTQCIGGVNTIETAEPHNFRTGDSVTILFTDNTSFWGDVPSIIVTDPTHFTYPRNRTSDIANQITPGRVALSFTAFRVRGSGNKFYDITYGGIGTTGAGKFNNFWNLYDDENVTIEHFNGTGGLNTSQYWVASYVFSGGALNMPSTSVQLAPVINVRDSSMTANSGACATVFNNNGFRWEDSVCQAQLPWQFNIGSFNGNFGQDIKISSIYSEYALSLNPLGGTTTPWPGIGIAGLIANPTSIRTAILTGGGPSGIAPTYGTGSTALVYYIIGHDVTAGAYTLPMKVLIYNSTGADNFTLYWPRMASSTDTIKYDIVSGVQPTITNGGYNPYPGLAAPGGSSTALGSVAVDVAQCSDLTCSYSIDTSVNTSAYTIPGGTWSPVLAFWPGSFVTSGVVAKTTSPVEVIASNLGNSNMGQVSDFCATSPNSGSGYTLCLGSYAAPNNANPNQAATIFTDGTTSGGGTSFYYWRKGRFNYQFNPGASGTPTNIFTIWDSQPGLTRATLNGRPPASPNDAWIGSDNPGSFSVATGFQLGIGSPNSISQYIGDVGNGSVRTYGERLTATKKTFNVPVQVGTYTVSTLPTASSFPGSVAYVTDSTTISAEGQTCTAGGSTKALAFSNGTVWKCF